MERAGHRTRYTLFLVALACFGTWACGTKNDTPGQSTSAGTVTLGGECRGYAECAPVTGKVIECRCTDQSSKPLCVADAEAGESCAITGNFQPVCRPGTFCIGLGTSNQATCMAPAAAGEACGNGASQCQDPYYCDTTFHCVLGQATLGQACDWLQSASCAAPNICSFNNVCTAPAAVGQSCTNPAAGERNPCVVGSACSGSVCEPLKPDGADCMLDDECSSGICSLDHCGTASLPSNVIYSCGL